MQTKAPNGERRGTSRRNTTSANSASRRKSPKAPDRLPWQERPYQQMRIASEIAQISEAGLYKAEKDGLLTFVRLAGRTLIETQSFIAFLNRAEPWTPSARGAEARARRIEVARAALRT